MKNKEKNSPPKWLKKLKKETFVTFRNKKNHLPPKCQDLELEFGKESWSSVKKKKFKIDLESFKNKLHINFVAQL